MHSRKEQLEAFSKLLDVMDELREGCPWDRKQTNQSLRPLTIEETYELAEAIMDNNDQEISKELGDLILHIVFYSKIGSEKNSFDIKTVCDQIVEKLIHRHPHIYDDVEANDEETVKKNWEALKLKEGKKSVLEGVPSGLPSLVKAIRLQEKAKGVGFEWENSNGALEKFEEEWQEFKEVLRNENSPDRKEDEFGDLLFSLVNLSRYYDVKADNALERCNQKFKKRFEYIEKKAAEMNKPLSEMTLGEMEKFWQQAKTI